MKGVRRPTPRPKPWAHDVIRASYRLPAEAKLVWRIISEFDSGQGCWAGDALLAQLVGIPLDRFRSFRDTLEAADLLRVVHVGGRAIWFAAVPADFPDDMKLEREDKLHLAERLDRALAASAASHPPVAKPQPAPASPSTTGPELVKTVTDALDGDRAFEESRRRARARLAQARGSAA